MPKFNLVIDVQDHSVPDDIKVIIRDGMKGDYGQHSYMPANYLSDEDVWPRLVEYIRSFDGDPDETLFLYWW